MASPTYERLKLRNGLRVVLAPDRSAPVVAVAVYYDVGIRSEPQGRTGFAHLFEHLMFQGSASLGKMELVNQISASGGVLNGSTRLDYTNYYEMLPSNALDRALFLEADRMGWPAVTEENLANQIAVVKEEIRVNVLNEPYGGFPWLTLAPVLYESWANAHDGYGSFEDLEQRQPRRRPRLLRRLLRTRQRRARGDRRLRGRPGRRAGAPTLRRRAQAGRAAASRLRRAGPDVGAARRAEGRHGPGTGSGTRLAGARPSRPRRLPAVRRGGLRPRHR